MKLGRDTTDVRADVVKGDAGVFSLLGEQLCAVVVRETCDQNVNTVKEAGVGIGKH